MLHPYLRVLVVQEEEYCRGNGRNGTPRTQGIRSSQFWFNYRQNEFQHAVYQVRITHIQNHHSFAPSFMKRKSSVNGIKITMISPLFHFRPPAARAELPSIENS